MPPLSAGFPCRLFLCSSSPPPGPPWAHSRPPVSPLPLFLSTPTVSPVPKSVLHPPLGAPCTHILRARPCLRSTPAAVLWWHSGPCPRPAGSPLGLCSFPPVLGALPNFPLLAPSKMLVCNLIMGLQWQVGKLGLVASCLPSLQKALVYSGTQQPEGNKQPAANSMQEVRSVAGASEQLA